MNEAADSLADNTFGSNSHSKANVLGVHLMDLAFNGYERHIHNGFAGFKSKLTEPGTGTKEGSQGAGVYGHVLGQAGAKLGGLATMVVGGLADAVDTAQKLYGTSQGPAEVAGNMAGWAVGRHINNFLTGKTPRDPNRLKNSLMSELCN